MLRDVDADGPAKVVAVNGILASFHAAGRAIVVEYETAAGLAEFMCARPRIEASLWATCAGLGADTWAVFAPDGRCIASGEVRR